MRIVPDPIDRAAVASLVVDRAHHGHWPTIEQRPDLEGRDGIVTIGPRHHPYSILMPADPAVAARVGRDPMLVAAWLAADLDVEARWAAVLTASRMEHSWVA